MNRYKITLICMLFASVAMAQIDQTRMKRDIEVASTVLSSLLDKQGIMNWQGVNGQPNGRYIEGYGVLLNMPNNHLVFGNIAFTPPAPPHPSDDFTYFHKFSNEETEGEDITITIEGENEVEIIEERIEERTEREQELAEREKELIIKAEAIANRTIKFLKLDSLKSENDEKRLEKMQIFLLDYAHLISQLKPDEKVLIIDKNSNTYGFDDMRSIEGLKRNRLSAEISMKDAMAFQSGKITREEALKRIVTNKNETPKTVFKDLELFKSIMNRIYSVDLSDSYYSIGPIGYEHIEEVGAIYYMKTVSSSMGSTGKWSIPTVGKTDVSQAERDEIIKNLYPKFEAQLKRNLVDYGRTISVLKDNEQLIFNVKITKCEGCSIPKTLELSISAQDLKDFNSGKIDQDTAIKRIKVKQGEMQ